MAVAEKDGEEGMVNAAITVNVENMIGDIGSGVIIVEELSKERVILNGVGGCGEGILRIASSQTTAKSNEATKIEIVSIEWDVS